MSYFFTQGSLIRQLFFRCSIAFFIGLSSIIVHNYFNAPKFIERPFIAKFYAHVDGVEQLPSRHKIRLILDSEGKHGLPRKIRVSYKTNDEVKQIAKNDIILVKARLMPPSQRQIPWGYDFAQKSWFEGVGATGAGLGAPIIIKKHHLQWGIEQSRQAVAQYIAGRSNDAARGIAVTLATGDRGYIGEEDAEALRNSGLAHLLSISGLHVTAVTGAVFLIISKILSLFPAFALRRPIPIYAAGGGAIAAIIYTLMTGSEIPTIRSCIAALLILTAISIGRQALTLRVIAAGIVVVILLWPQALVGPSFQLSFAAVTTIILLHQSKWMKDLTTRREESYFRKIGRFAISLLITGLAIEMILSPIALFHFHKTGIYGAAANLFAIPWVTFLVMPVQALAMFLDILSLGGPIWAICNILIEILNNLAHFVSSASGSLLRVPAIEGWQFAILTASMLFFGLVQSRIKWVGILIYCAMLMMIFVQPKPDLFILSDGKHLILDHEGQGILLRSRTGDYTSEMLSEAIAQPNDAISMDEYEGANCNMDSCIFQIAQQNKRPHLIILATRSDYLIPAMELAATCRRVDIVISSRYLPQTCQPRWIKIDKGYLQENGGVAFFTKERRMMTVADQDRHKPWTRFIENKKWPRRNEQHAK
ncbi:ComEC/Rec2 family competence protein [Sphingorhabdus lutea]|uniref:ComEC/Rec2 family competence protein n=1 Tax=Sphingorhabdus lutea TaxID=1913578 RepID=UPI0018DDE739|nr:ComEC/Rec2 family competence protein [Sphingorhabdus lutea]